jgi:hypothetical protein
VNVTARSYWDGPNTSVHRHQGQQLPGACWAAAEALALITGLVLLGTFVGESKAGKVAKFLYRLALLRPWDQLSGSYFRKL